MFLVGLYLNCDQAVNRNLVTHVIDQIDSLVERNASPHEVFSFFQVKPSNS